MPVKFDWMEISRVEMSDTTSSRGAGCGAGSAAAARPRPKVASRRANASAARIMHLPGAG